MNITEETAMVEFVIQGATFSIPQPYAEGYQLKEGKAAALNQVLRENVRNNFAKKVATALEAVGGAVDNLDTEELQTELDAYVANYEFGVRAVSMRASADPIVREAKKLARKKILEVLRAKGIKQTDLPEGQMEAYIEDAIKRPEVLEAAKRIVAATEEVSGITLG